MCVFYVLEIGYSIFMDILEFHWKSSGEVLVLGVYIVYEAQKTSMLANNI